MFRSSRVQPLFVLTLLSLTLAVCGCVSKEEEARSLYNRALAADREHRGDEAKALMETIVRQYSQTETAIQANQALTLQVRAKELAQTTLLNNERTAAMTLRAINEASLAFRSLSQGNYPRDLHELADAGLIDVRAQHELGGYRFRLDNLENAAPSAMPNRLFRTGRDRATFIRIPAVSSATR